MKNTKSFDIALGKLLAQARRSKKLSQRQLAQLVDIPRGSIATWEVGDAPITMKNCIKICKVLGVDYGTLAELAWEDSQQ